MINDCVSVGEVTGGSDSERIQNAVNLAKEKGVNAITIPRLNSNGKDYYEITKAVRLPSDMTVYLDNCRLVTPKEVACNFFCNETYNTPDETDPEKEQHDINIIGIGNALLDGENTTDFPSRIPVRTADRAFAKILCLCLPTAAI